MSNLQKIAVALKKQKNSLSRKCVDVQKEKIHVPMRNRSHLQK